MKTHASQPDVAFFCPRCQASNARRPLGDSRRPLACSQCGIQIDPPAGAVQEGRLSRCLICASEELYVRKDFNQRLGLTIIVFGFVVSSVFWAWHQSLLSYATLALTAVADAVLYLLTGNALRCYRCQAEYRHLADLDGHHPFDLETHERHRQQAARLEDAQRPQAT